MLGMARTARTPMMTTVTSSSMRVKPPVTAGVGAGCAAREGDANMEATNREG